MSYISSHLDREADTPQCTSCYALSLLTRSFNTMAKPLPVGCRLTALFDSCHSGTVMNLPYVVSGPVVK